MFFSIILKLLNVNQYWMVVQNKFKFFRLMFLKSIKQYLNIYKLQY